jgi:putative tryptophan/tyrosine transport system substrate-binding protein
MHFRQVKRREFITLLGWATVGWPLAARAQEAGRTYRLGCLLPLLRTAPINVAFFDELRRRGFIEGQNLTVEYRAYGLHVDLVSEYAAELVKARVDVIVTAGDVATIRAAQQATKTIPILAMTDDMVRLGLVASMARPDGNTTGVSIFALELDGKRQEILIEAVPGLRRMAYLADANFETVAKLDALQEAARARNIDLSIHRIAKGEEITAAIDAAKASGAEGLNFSASPLFFTYRQLIMDRVAALRLPAIYEWPETAEESGFAAYGPRLSQLFVDVMTQQLVKLFHGIKVADIPVEQPTKFELVINLKIAKAMGVTVPESLSARADKVIE